MIKDQCLKDRSRLPTDSQDERIIQDQRTQEFTLIVVDGFKGTAGFVISEGTLTGIAQLQVSKDNNEHVMQISPIGGLSVIGSINGTTTSFLIDTGAAVTSK